MKKYNRLFFTLILVFSSHNIFANHSAEQNPTTSIPYNTKLKNKPKESNDEIRLTYILHSASIKSLPINHIKNIANPEQFHKSKSEFNETTYTYQWHDLTVSIKEMNSSEIKPHINGFIGYIKERFSQRGKPMSKALEKRIASTSMVLSISVSPEIDIQGRAEDIIGAIAYNSQSLMFFENSLYDENSDLII